MIAMAYSVLRLIVFFDGIKYHPIFLQTSVKFGHNLIFEHAKL